MVSLIASLPESPNMDRFRNFTVQTGRPQAQSIDEQPSGPIGHQDNTPTILSAVLDGAVGNISSSDYAKRCREIIDLYKDLRDLGYVFFFCVSAACSANSNPVYMPLLIFPAWSLSGDNQVSARDDMISRGSFFLIIYIHRRKELTRRGCERCEYLHLRYRCYRL